MARAIVMQGERWEGVGRDGKVQRFKLEEGEPENVRHSVLERVGEKDKQAETSINRKHRLKSGRFKDR